MSRLQPGDCGLRDSVRPRYFRLRLALGKPPERFLALV